MDSKLEDLDPKSGVQQLENEPTELRENYVKPGFAGLFQSKFVVACAVFVTVGSYLFGYDQGVISIILVEPQFLDRFQEVADSAPGGGFYKGLLTAMIELGAFLGAANSGWLVDRISRKYSIVVASIVFIIGSILQAASIGYRIILCGRLVGGIGVGMLSMVAPL